MAQASDTLVETTKRWAELLTSLYVLLILAIWLLNGGTSAQTDNDIRWARWVGTALGRSRAFASRSPVLYADLAMYQLSSDSVFSAATQGFVHAPSDGQIVWPVSGTDQAMFVFEQKDHATRFGTAAAEIMAQVSDRSARVPLLQKALVDSFEPKLAVRLKELPEYVAWSDTEVAGPLSGALNWILLGSPMNSGGEWGTREFGVSYVPRAEADVKFDSRVSRLYAVAFQSMTCAELQIMLQREWQRAQDNVARHETSQVRMELPGTHTELALNQLLLIVTPMLALLVVVFYLHWHERTRSGSSFAFPDFGAPSDPLSRPISPTLFDIGRRLIWSVFLTLPIVLVWLGVATRYQIAYVINNSRYYRSTGRAHLLAFSELRAHDWFSAGIDLGNASALAICLAVIIATTRSPTTNRSASANRYMLAVFVTVALLHTVLIPLIPQWTLSIPDHFVFLTVDGIWVIAFFQALRLRSHFGVLVTLLGLFLTLLLSSKYWSRDSHRIGRLTLRRR